MEVNLVIVEGPDAGREFPLSGAIVIGRDPSAGIVLEDGEVSRRHASVSLVEGGAEVEDLGSTNGTYVNGERIEGSRRLSSGDRFRVGTTVVELRAVVQATKIGTTIPEEPDTGKTAIASVIPDAPPPGAGADGGEDDLPTVVPDEEPAQPAAAAPPPAPEPAAPAPPPPAASPPPPPPPPQAAPPPPPPPQAPPPPPQAAPPPPPQFAPAPPQAPAPQFGGPVPAGPPGFPAAPGQAPVAAAGQAGPGFQVRNPIAEWALQLVPFYGLVWYYRLCKELGEWSGGRIHTSPGTSVLAITLGAMIIVPPWVSLIGTMNRLRQAQQMAGVQPTISFGGFFGRALLFGYGYKWLTEQINELAVRRPVQ